MRFTIYLLLMSLVPFVLVGCGGSGRPPLGEVTGTVSYNGQPLQSGTIVFEVDGARPSTGKIVNGQITEVTTYDPNDGVPVGLARIAVFAVDGSGASPGPAPAETPAGDPDSYKPGANYMDAGSRPLIPAKYNDPSSSGLTWQIEEDENVLRLNLSD
jgi:hypothetical protein